MSGANLRTPLTATTASGPHPSQQDSWGQIVAQALGALQIDEQRFIRLSYFEGLTQVKIAEQAGLPVAFVSRTVAAGMRRLGLALEAWLELSGNP